MSPQPACHPLRRPVTKTLVVGAVPAHHGSWLPGTGPTATRIMVPSASRMTRGKMSEPEATPGSGVAGAVGLTTQVAEERLRVEGPNTIEEHGRRSTVTIPPASFRARSSCCSSQRWAVAIVLPLSPLATLLGFSALPPLFWLALATFVVAYLAIVEVVKRWLYRLGTPDPATTCTLTEPSRAAAVQPGRAGSAGSGP
jgi:hypothetical protein